jgi:hypothetical protein
MAIWAGLATFVALLVLDGAWAGSTLLRSLTRARSELTVAIESVVTGDPEAAATHFLAARAAADRALGAAGHPSLELGGLLPFAGENIDAAAAVAEASRATAVAGTTMVGVARDLRWSDIGIPAATAAGRLDLGAIRTALPDMGSVARRLAEARDMLEAAGSGGLIGPVASGYRDAVEGLTRRADLAARFRDTLRLVPAMFGGERPRRYLVCVPTLGMPRPGGGVPASVGLLVARDGTLQLDALAPAPDGIKEVTSSPDWPTTARALADAATQAGFPRLDGVILLDAAALEDMVWAIGDVPVAGRTFTLTDRDTEDALEIEAFSGTSPRKTALRHAGWASEVLQAFLSERPAVETFALAAAEGVRDHHLSVYLRRPDEQRLVRALGLDGRANVAAEGVLPVVASWSALGSSHVGAFVETRLRQNVTVREDGSAVVGAEVLFENGAGTDDPSVLFGRMGSEFPVGTFAADVTMYVPVGARNVEAETSRPSPIRVGEELGLITVTGSISVRGGDSTTLTVSYVADDAVQRTGDGNGVALRLLPQPTIAGVTYRIRVSLPEGSTIVAASRDLDLRGETATYSAVRSGPLDLELRYA